ncbi:hypothetical protein Fcan01_08444 [Folsomia candida]|uniref:Uncharacterized protein n=1 Tax=Folsomia candida TaxID=158441 RepID=A0A226ENJ2_FOLCA|nr:hypothetical protein Fcan01_08444 [Folsomia candida]
MNAVVRTARLGRSAGIGNFQSDPRNNPYLPFGAFAGLNLGQRDGERVGAGCSGLTCGFQLGNLALSTRQLFDAVTNGNGRFKVGIRSSTTTTAPALIKSLESFSDVNPEINDVETSETFLTGVTLSERFDSVRGFLTDMFLGLLDMLGSIFGSSPSSSSTRDAVGNTPSASSASHKNQTVYRITLGPPPTKSPSKVPSVSPTAENTISASNKLRRHLS